MARIKPAADKAPKKDPATVAGERRWFPSSATRLGFVLLVLVASGYGARVLWMSLRDDVSQADEYRLTANRIEITQPPEWIRADIKSEIIRDGSLAGPASLLDERLAQRIHTAAMLHPWVANAEVRLHYPARVEIVVEYRRPVAMVEVPGGLLPIDKLGIILPTDDFRPTDTGRYPRVAGIKSGPAGIGTPWGDPAVNEAAGIADELSGVWDELKLATISPADAPSTGDPLEWQLTARAGWRALWGNAPGKEPENEPKAKEKIAQLKEAALSTANMVSGEVIDLRNRSTIAHRPATPSALK